MLACLLPGVIGAIVLFSHEYFDQRARQLAAGLEPGIHIFLSAPDGRQVVNTLRDFGEPLPRHGNPEQLGRVLASGRAMVSDIHGDALAPHPFVSVDLPVPAGDGAAYVLSVGILPQRLNAILSSQHLPDDWIASVHDHHGTIAARNRSPEQFVGQKGSPGLLARLGESANEGVVETATREGIPVAYAYSRSPSTGWTVAIGIPRLGFEAPLMHTLSRLALGVGSLFAIGLESSPGSWAARSPPPSAPSTARRAPWEMAKPFPRTTPGRRHHQLQPGKALCPQGRLAPLDQSHGRLGPHPGQGAGLLHRRDRGHPEPPPAEEQLRKFRLAVEQSPVSIVITDPAGRMEYVDPRFTQAEEKLARLFETTNTSDKEKELLKAIREAESVAQPLIRRVADLGLANKNKEATRMLIKEVRGPQGKRSQVAAQEIGQLAGDSVGLAEKAGKLLDEIVPATKKTADLVQEITSASEEQTSGVGQINTAMSQLSQINQQNASASEQLAATAEEMSSQADHLQQHMAFFTIASDGRAPAAGAKPAVRAAAAPHQAKPVRAGKKGNGNAVANPAEFTRF